MVTSAGAGAGHLPLGGPGHRPHDVLRPAAAEVGLRGRRVEGHQLVDVGFRGRTPVGLGGQALRDSIYAWPLVGRCPVEQILVANQVASRKLSVRETEKLVANRPSVDRRPSGTDRTQPVKSRDLLRIEEQIADRLAAAVDIRLKRGNRGEVAIAFHSLDELDGILQRLGPRNEAPA